MISDFFCFLLVYQYGFSSYFFFFTTTHICLCCCHFEKQLRKQLGRDSTYAGTTCVVVLAFGNDLWIGNAGDSRAVVCAVDPTNSDFVVRLASVFFLLFRVLHCTEEVDTRWHTFKIIFFVPCGSSFCLVALGALLFSLRHDSRAASYLLTILRWRKTCLWTKSPTCQRSGSGC